MDFYPFLHLYTDLPEEKLNLVVNKRYINPYPRALFAYHTPLPHTHTYNTDVKYAVNLVRIYLLIIILLRFLSHKFLDKMNSDKSQKVTNLSINSLEFCNYIKVKLWFCSGFGCMRGEVGVSIDWCITCIIVCLLFNK